MRGQYCLVGCVASRSRLPAPTTPSPGLAGQRRAGPAKAGTRATPHVGSSGDGAGTAENVKPAGMMHLQVPAIDGACQPPTKSAAAAAASTLKKRKRNPETQVPSSKSGSDRAGAPSPARSSSTPTACGSRGAYGPDPGGSARMGRAALPEECHDQWNQSVGSPFVAAHSTPRDCKADLARHLEISHG